MKMNKQNLLIMAMVGVAGYLVYKGMRVGGVGTSTTGLKGTAFPQLFLPIAKPAQGQAYDPLNPGQFIWMTDLMNGTAHEIATGTYDYNSNVFAPISSALKDFLNANK